MAVEMMDLLTVEQRISIAEREALASIVLGSDMLRSVILEMIELDVFPPAILEPGTEHDVVVKDDGSFVVRRTRSTGEWR
jgi:hypothetical protein